MELLEIPIAPSSALTGEKVLTRSVRKVFYVSNGRNAWHSTWVRQYSDGCVHSTLASAKSHAERLRNNGSVFYVRELPVLTLQTSIKRTVLIAQLNVANPFKHYKPNGSYWRTETRRASIPAVPVNSTLQSVMSAFAHSSIYWDVAPEDWEPILMFNYPALAKSLGAFNDTVSLSYRSFAIGSQYSLAWSTEPNKITSHHIKRVLNTRPRSHARHDA